MMQWMREKEERDTTKNFKQIKPNYNCKVCKSMGVCDDTMTERERGGIEQLIVNAIFHYNCKVCKGIGVCDDALFEKERDGWRCRS